jgi:hypothetical protein
MTYKKTSTTLAIAVIATLMVSASVVVALTIVTHGVGISHVDAILKRTTQVNAQESGDPCLQPPNASEEQACQEAMQKSECMQLKDKMASDNTAADLYQKKDCAGLLGQ